MIALIDIKISSNQSVEVSTQKIPQEIQIINLPRQDIPISLNESQNVDILNANPYQKIDVVTPWTTREEYRELKVAIDSKVPKALSLLPQAENESFATSKLRNASKIYVDIAGNASFATMEQVKELNTKTIFVDGLTDKKIQTLSNEDIILLREE